MAGLAVAGALALGAASPGVALVGGQYQPQPPLKKCLKQAKKKDTAQARKQAAKKCHKKYG
jgi:hypothetical protein